MEYGLFVWSLIHAARISFQITAYESEKEGYKIVKILSILIKKGIFWRNSNVLVSSGLEVYLKFKWQMKRWLDVFPGNIPFRSL